MNGFLLCGALFLAWLIRRISIDRLKFIGHSHRCAPTMYPTECFLCVYFFHFFFCSSLPFQYIQYTHQYMHVLASMCFNMKRERDLYRLERALHACSNPSLFDSCCCCVFFFVLFCVNMNVLKVGWFDGSIRKKRLTVFISVSVSCV